MHRYQESDGEKDIGKTCVLNRDMKKGRDEGGSRTG